MLIVRHAASALFGLLLIQVSGLGQDGLPEGFVPLFNGKDLSGWTAKSDGQFSVKEGVLVQNRGGGWLRSTEEYQDFELHVTFRFVSPGSNSGIYFRANDDAGPNVNYQVQTRDDSSIGSLYFRGRDKPNERKDVNLAAKALKPGDAWQEYVVTVKGAAAEVRLNGELINKADKLSTDQGYIGIQGEGGHLEFKRIAIKPLSPSP